MNTNMNMNPTGVVDIEWCAIKSEQLLDNMFVQDGIPYNTKMVMSLARSILAMKTSDLLSAPEPPAPVMHRLPESKPPRMTVFGPSQRPVNPETKVEIGFTTQPNIVTEEQANKYESLIPTIPLLPPLGFMFYNEDNRARRVVGLWGNDISGRCIITDVPVGTSGESKSTKYRYTIQDIVYLAKRSKGS